MIIQENPNFWTEREEQTNSHLFYWFSETFAPLNIEKQEIFGNVLVIGHGSTFPERLFITTPESHHKSQRPEIQSISTCDPGFHTNPWLRVNLPVDIKPIDEQPDLSGKVVNYYPTFFEIVFPNINKLTFDTVLFCRIPHLYQYFDQHVKLIHPVLKPNAIFIGSGCFNNCEEPEIKSKNLFHPIHIAKLPNPDYLGGIYHPHHIGFKLKKIEA